MISPDGRRPRILVVGDAVGPTGFARVIRALFTPLCARYELHQLGTNYAGDPHDWPWQIYPAAGGAFGAARLVPLVGALEPDLIFILHDVWAIRVYLEALGDGVSPPVLGYCSVDAGPVDPETAAPLARCAHIAVYTEYARRLMVDALGAGRGTPPVTVHPLGFDAAAFHPLAEDRRTSISLARRRLFPDRSDMADAFIVLNANRNQPRKRLDLTLQGFARFAAGKPPGVFLHLHLDASDPLGWEIRRLARRLRLEDRLILSSRAPGMPALSDVELNDVYNAADIGINTAAGEGWGLIAFEQAAAGVPQVVPAHTSGLELWQGAAELLPVATTLVEPLSLTEAHLVDPAAVAAALERLYRKPRYREELGRVARINSRRAAQAWSASSERWDLLFRRLTSPSRRRPC